MHNSETGFGFWVGRAILGAVAGAGILAGPARDAFDEMALEMFRRRLDPKVCRAEIVSSDRPISEIVSMVADGKPSVVRIASLPPGGLAHTRLLCKRLRGRFPDLKIVAGRWGLKAKVEENREQLVAAGADHFGTTLEETSTRLLQLSRFIKRFADAGSSRSPASRNAGV